MRRLLAAIVVGFVLGFAGAQVLFLGWWTLIPWGIGGLALGLCCNRPGVSLMTGSVYGFVLIFIFMVEQYTGNVSMIRRVPFFGVLALFGSVCGMILTFGGYLIRQASRKNRTGFA